MTSDVLYVFPCSSRNHFHTAYPTYIVLGARTIRSRTAETASRYVKLLNIVQLSLSQACSQSSFRQPQARLFFPGDVELLNEL